MKKIVISTILAANLLIVLYFWWSNSGVLLTRGLGNSMLAIARLTGLIAVLGICLQFLLIGRQTWVEQLFGLDKLARIHHITGQVSFIFIVLHPLLITGSYSLISGKNFFQQELDIINSFEDTFQAGIAVFLFTVIVGFSIYIVRKRLKYETWYYVHLLTYLAVLLAWGHQLKNGEDFLVQPLFTKYWYALYIIVFGSFVYSRFFQPLYSFYKHRFFVQSIKPESYDTNSVIISGKNMQTFKFQAGQFVKVRFLAKNYWKESHPFSLSQPFNGKNLRLSIKASGDFTKTIRALLVNTPILIEGPYGIFTKNRSTKQKVLLIAGGIGITPIRSLIEDLGPLGKQMTLLYGNKSENDIVFKSELEELAKKYSLTIHHILNTPPSPNPNNYLAGFIDKQKVQDLVKDYLEHEVFVCGPPVMINKLIPALKELGIKNKDIYFEKFSL